ncbi:MAG: cytochrome-c peroxidase [Longimicrobiales bacterium]
MQAASTGLIALAILTAALAAPAGDLSPEPAAVPSNLPAPVSDSDFHQSGRDGAAGAAKVELGRLLFFDKVLSGNQNISCATCHHPDLKTSDGLALGLGEGPTGLGPDRTPGQDPSSAVHGRVPRNSPGLFNLGAIEFQTLFHDGRVELDTAGFYESGFITPAKWKFPKGLENTLAAQAMFPVTSPEEMAGQKGENEIADAVSLNNAAGPGGVWELLGQRLQAIPEYVSRFQAAYPDQVQSKEHISFVLAANAIAAFETEAFRADDSPFDRYLRGNGDAMGPKAQRGMALFYGDAGCSDCHAGKFQTDHDFHAIAMPQVGPGKGDGRDAAYWSESGHQSFLEDFGRGRVTVRTEDNFKFRTPSLRNVADTGPWGHAGAYDNLEAVVRHHLDPVTSLEAYRLRKDLLPEMGPVLEITAAGSRFGQEWLTTSRRRGFLMRDGWVQSQAHLRQRIADANELAPSELNEGQVEELIAFLEDLTDLPSDNPLGTEPKSVPSGLAVKN